MYMYILSFIDMWKNLVAFTIIEQCEQKRINVLKIF